jgi:hypothetical protein
MMPTGYTSDLYEGKDVTVGDFILGCARAFGALITMRDDPADAPIPDQFEPSDYHAKKVAEAQERLMDLAAMSPEQMEREAFAEFEQAHARWVQRRSDAAARRERYEAMLCEVRRWRPPTADHDGLKVFMLQQLESSIDFDCSMSYDHEPVLLSAETWHRERVEKAKRDIEYHVRENEAECKRATERSQWVKALRESLPTPSMP